MPPRGGDVEVRVWKGLFAHMKPLLPYAAEKGARPSLQVSAKQKEPFAAGKVKGSMRI